MLYSVLQEILHTTYCTLVTIYCQYIVSCNFFNKYYCNIFNFTITIIIIVQYYCTIFFMYCKSKKKNPKPVKEFYILSCSQVK